MLSRLGTSQAAPANTSLRVGSGRGEWSNLGANGPKMSGTAHLAPDVITHDTCLHSHSLALMGVN